jgi:hypothetical protein
MAFTGKDSFEFPQTLDDDKIRHIEAALATHGAKVDATAQTLTQDATPSRYTFTCTVDVADQMAANTTAGIVLRRALADFGYFSRPGARLPNETDIS